MFNRDLPPLPNAVSKLRPTLPRPVLQRNLPEPSALVAPSLLRHGCYFLQYVPITMDSPGLNTQMSYQGTMRVEKHGDLIQSSIEPLHFDDALTISADLYIHDGIDQPDPADGIPIFPRNHYRCYLRVTSIQPAAVEDQLEGADSLQGVLLTFDRYRYYTNNHSWSSEGQFEAVLQPVAALPDAPDETDRWTGRVFGESGLPVAQMTLDWVSPYLRQAVIEVDRVAQAEAPLENSQGLDWPTIFAQADWDVTLQQSDDPISEPSGETWSLAELHAAMLESRDTTDLDKAWHYHLLCVQRIKGASRGIMYDSESIDSNNLPREGAAVATHWQIPDSESWGTTRGMRFGQASDLYFRTAVHEIGHTMGLRHNLQDTGFMMATSVLTRMTGEHDFPDNIAWRFSDINSKRLRHMPDPWVRPGMMPANRPFAETPISRDDLYIETEGLRLTVEPLLEVVPMGAPVRINLRLHNEQGGPAQVPDSLSLKSEHVRGSVIDPAGTERTFQSVFQCVDGEHLQTLESQESIQHAVTLLRGVQGALFPTPGIYQIELELLWHVEGVLLKVSDRTYIMVTPPVDEAHARAALKALTTPDLLLTLALGGDHLQDGIEALQVALDNPVLRPHFAVVEAKRIGQRFRKRSGEPTTACGLMDASTVVSCAEIKRMAEIIQKTRRDHRHSGVVGKAVDLLRAKTHQMAQKEAVDQEIVEMVGRL